MSGSANTASCKKPWLKHYKHDAFCEQIPNLSTYQYIKESNKNHLSDTALHYYGRNISFREFFSLIDRCADAFSGIGVKENTIVSVLSVSIPETVVAIYALNKIGATANTIDPRMDVQSIKRMILDSESKILLALDIVIEKVKRIERDIAQEYIILQSPLDSLPFFPRMCKKSTAKKMPKCTLPYISWSDFLNLRNSFKATEAEYRGDRTVAITYTGGTTGTPKGVMLTNDNLNAVAFNFKHSSIKRNRGETFLGIIPIFSSYGLVCGLHMPLSLGLTVILVPNFQPDTMGKLIKKFKPNHIISVPAFYEIMMESRDMKNFDLSFLVTIGSGGDTMHPGLEEKLKNFMNEHNMNRPPAQGYGMSEMSAAVSFCAEETYKPGSVGIPSITTTIGIFKPDAFDELNILEEGEICMKGPSMMKGYFKNDDETKNVIRRHPDGTLWVHSGDVGYLDEDGFLFVNGRIKRMITRFDGHKIFPINIESLVSGHPNVKNCCAIAIKDRAHAQGQVPLVIVELNDCDKDSVCREIFDICNDVLEERGKPVGVISIDTIPFTGIGKNDYRMLEKTYKEFDYTLLF